MAGSGPNQDVFDVRKIRRLVELMKEHDLSELDLRQGETRIQLRRGSEPVFTAQQPLPAPTGPPVGAAAATPAPEASKSAEPPADSSKTTQIISPMVGTFYTAPEPESPPFVKVGDHVGPDTIVCIVEAMKVFNQIPAEVSGKITAVLIAPGEPVEFGQPMYTVEMD